MNILIIEDDIILASHIARTFSSCVITNRIKILSSPLEFMQHIYAIGTYDIILTDLILSPDSGDFSGYTVIEKIRERYKDVPIIIISGKGEIDTLREAFDLGATDYLIKPFRLKELEVRVNHWFKDRYLSKMICSENKYTHSSIGYDIKKNEFYKNGVSIMLTRSHKYLLFLFFSNPGVLLSHSFLREKIWGDYDDFSERNIRVSILRLRSYLRTYDLHRKIITVRGEGYIFEGDYSSI